MSLSKYQEDPVIGVDWFFYREGVGEPIKRRKLIQADVDNINVFQTYFTLYLDKGGSSREMSINYANSRNLVDRAKEILSKFSNDPSTLEGCKMRELEDLYEWTCSPPHSYSLHFYTLEWIARRLKFCCRILIGGHFSMDPYSSFLTLKPHLKIIKEQITSLLHLMPKVRREYFLNPPPPPPTVLLVKELPPPPQNETKYLVSAEVDNQNSTLDMSIIVNSVSTGNALLDEALRVEGENERKPYPCDVCPKRFKTRTDLSKHARVHSVEKHFHCHLCDKSFRLSQFLII